MDHVGGVRTYSRSELMLVHGFIEPWNMHKEAVSNSSYNMQAVEGIVFHPNYIEE